MQLRQARSSPPPTFAMLESCFAVLLFEHFLVKRSGRKLILAFFPTISHTFSRTFPQFAAICCTFAFNSNAFLIRRMERPQTCGVRLVQSEKPPVCEWGTMPSGPNLPEPAAVAQPHHRPRGGGAGATGGGAPPADVDAGPVSRDLRLAVQIPPGISKKKWISLRLVRGICLSRRAPMMWLQNVCLLHYFFPTDTKGRKQ